MITRLLKNISITLAVILSLTFAQPSYAISGTTVGYGLGMIGFLGGIAAAFMMPSNDGGEEDTSDTTSPLTSDGVSFSEPGDRTLTINNPRTVSVNVDSITVDPASNISPITTPTNCQPIAAGESCEATVTAPSNTENGTWNITVAYETTESLVTTATVDIDPLTSNDVSFTQPGNQTLTINNPRAATVNVDSITVDPASGISSISTPANCQPIATNGSCNVTVNAPNTAKNGNWDITIAYQTTESIIANASVGTTILELQQCSEKSAVGCADTNKWSVVSDSVDVAVENEKSPKYLKYVVKSGGFPWNKNGGTDYVIWNQTVDTKTETDVITLETKDSELNSKCGDAQISAGDACAFTLVNKDGQDYPGSWGILAATGNAGNIAKNVLAHGGLEIVLNQDTSQQHFQYRSLKVVSTMGLEDDGSDSSSGSTQVVPVPVTIQSVVATPSDADKIHYCTPTDTECDAAYRSTCPVGKVLNYNDGGCLLWFKSKDQDGFGLGQATNISVAPVVTGTYQDPETQQQKTITEQDDVFTFNYEQALYLGGKFTAFGASTLNGIVKYDGTNFAPLGTDISSANSNIYSLNIYKGDLYAGGDFNFNGFNLIAKWNGLGWSTLSGGLTDHVVYGLATYNDQLHTFGNITLDNYRDRIAKWDETNWLPLGTKIAGGNMWIKSFASFNNKIYAAGIFRDFLGDGTTSTVVNWDGSNWESVIDLPASSFGASFLEADNTTNKLYAYGQLTTDYTNRIGTWTNTSGPTFSNAINDDVYALLASGNELYIGGDFNTIRKLNGAGFDDLFTIPNFNSNFDTTYSLTTKNNALYAIATTVYTSSNECTLRKWENFNGSSPAYTQIFRQTNASGNIIRIYPSITKLVRQESESSSSSSSAPLD